MNPVVREIAMEHFFMALLSKLYGFLVGRRGRIVRQSHFLARKKITVLVQYNKYHTAYSNHTALLVSREPR